MGLEAGIRLRCLERVLARGFDYRNSGSRIKSSWGFGLAAEFSPASPASDDFASPSAVAWVGGSSGPRTPHALKPAAAKTSAAIKSGFMVRNVSIGRFRNLWSRPPSGLSWVPACAGMTRSIPRRSLPRTQIRGRYDGAGARSRPAITRTVLRPPKFRPPASSNPSLAPFPIS